MLCLSVENFDIPGITLTGRPTVGPKCNCNDEFSCLIRFEAGRGFVAGVVCCVS